MTGATLLYAPNVHTGGGLVLLRSLLDCWPARANGHAFLDHRAQGRLSVPAGVTAKWVLATPTSRLGAERWLRAIARPGDTLLCFHGLPPLLSNPAHVVVFQQNRIYLGLMPLSQFRPRTALRLVFERTVNRWCRGHVDEYIVQTPTMARALTRWHGGQPAVRVLPFATAVATDGRREPPFAWDFVYVADGEAHKNHARLLQAWELLAGQGLRPRLALTLGPRDGTLVDQVRRLRESTGVEIHNQGQLDHRGVLALMAAARALVFPSLGESLGLPLIEARQLGVPIVASELDYVRDVCTPAQTFDPRSAVSIARAVRRFLGEAEPPLAMQPPEALWAALGIAAAGPAAP